MPVVPFSANTPPRVPGQTAPNVDPTYLAMAAATMHEQGRLFEQPPQPKAPK